MIHVDADPFTGPLAGALQTTCTEPEIYWLGQAGFLFRLPGLAWVMDPYLSDRLAEKYRHHELSHERMMPAPISVEDLPEVDLVCCSHHHGDHMDPPTLAWLAANRRRTRFVMPAGIAAEAGQLRLPADRVLWAEAGRPIHPAADFDILPLPAAHEDFGYDARGYDRFLGYVFCRGPLKVYHSGDTIPYAGLAERLEALRPDLALLPVNGRRPELSRQHIAGNFSLAEAVGLCRCARIPVMIAHHFGMFAFNTIDPDLIDAAAREAEPEVRVLRAETGVRYRLTPDTA